MIQASAGFFTYFVILAENGFLPDRLQHNTMTYIVIMVSMTNIAVSLHRITSKPFRHRQIVRHSQGVGFQVSHRPQRLVRARMGECLILFHLFILFIYVFHFFTYLLFLNYDFFASKLTRNFILLNRFFTPFPKTLPHPHLN